MTKILLVGAGGFLGAVSRYLLNGYVARLVTDPALPWGTLAVNILGCFLIGLFAQLGQSRNFLSPEMGLLLMVGLLGGFTTFSTFGMETFSIAREGQMLDMALNISLHVILGLGAVWAGTLIALRLA